jgi:hypothetical protein
MTTLKQLIYTLALLAFVSTLMLSCKTDAHVVSERAIQKRKYRTGYHLAFNSDKKNQNHSENELAQVIPPAQIDQIVPQDQSLVQHPRNPIKRKKARNQSRTNPGSERQTTNKKTPVVHSSNSRGIDVALDPGDDYVSRGFNKKSILSLAFSAAGVSFFIMLLLDFGAIPWIYGVFLLMVVLCAIVGVVLGIRSLREIKYMEQDGKALAMAGLIAGAAQLGILVTLIVLTILFWILVWGVL